MIEKEDLAKSSKEVDYTPPAWPSVAKALEQLLLHLESSLENINQRIDDLAQEADELTERIKETRYARKQVLEKIDAT